MNKIFAIFFLFPAFNAFCQPGSTCETAINAGEPGFTFPELPPGSKRWYYFAAHSAKCKLEIPPGNSFVLYQRQGDDFCGSLNKEPAKQELLAKRNISSAGSGFELPSLSEEVMNGKCDCHSCTGGKFSEELQQGSVYYLLVIGKGKDIKLGFIPLATQGAAGGNDPQEATVTGNAPSGTDPLQKFINQKSLEQLNAGESIMLKSVNFKHRSTQLMEDSYIDLERVYKYMNQYSKAKIEVQGHVDGSGRKGAGKAEEEFAMKLSEGRAKAIRDYLVRKGIDASRIVYKGYGTSEMVYFGNDEDYLKYNRRVVVKILEK